jgi:hypothetical protein
MRFRTLLPLTVAALAGCSVNRPVQLTPEPNALGAYVAAHHPADLLITDSAGHSQWVHAPRVDGDTLRGVPGTDLPPMRLAIPVSTIRSVEAPHFSTGRTLGFVGSIVAAAGLALVIISSGTGPVY